MGVQRYNRTKGIYRGNRGIAVQKMKYRGKGGTRVHGMYKAA